MKDRRELLKGLAVGSVWATPVVSSVVLPVHADTSGCGGIEPGCTIIWNESYYQWPGGTGPHQITDYWFRTVDSSSCAGDAPFSEDPIYWYVIASSPDKAESLLKANNINPVNIELTEEQDPRLPEGCNMYSSEFVE